MAKSPSRFELVREYLAAVNDEAVLFDGYEDALVGTCQRFNEAGHHIFVALYDRRRCIQILVERDRMSEDEAVEFFEFNTAGCYAGPHTPAFTTLAPDIEDWMTGNLKEKP